MNKTKEKELWQNIKSRNLRADLFLAYYLCLYKLDEKEKKKNLIIRDYNMILTYAKMLNIDFEANLNVYQRNK